MNYNLHFGKRGDLLKGFLQYDGKDYAFSYTDGILDIYTSYKSDWLDNKHEILSGLYLQESQRGEIINDINLNGILSDGEDVIFNVSEQGLNSNGFISFNVNSYYVYKKQECYYKEHTDSDGKVKRIPEKEDNQIDQLIVSGRDIDFFFNPASAYRHTYEMDKKTGNATFSVKAFTAVEKECGTVEWMGIDIEICVKSIVTAHAYSATPLTSRSEMIFKFSKAITLKQTDQFLAALQQCFAFLCRRTNIEFDPVKMVCTSGRKKRQFGKYTFLCIGDTSEVSVNAAKRVVGYEYLKEKFALLLKPFLEEKMYTNHIPDNVAATKQYGPDRIIFNFVAFEREYQNFYPEEKVRSEDFIAVKKEILERIDELCTSYHGKKKRYAKSFKRSIEKSENSFGERLKFAISQHEEYIKVFLINNYGQNYYEKIPEICQRMNDLRNDSAHGNFITDFKSEYILDFEIIECLLYAMRLKWIGLSPINVQRAICSVMGINLYIPDETELNK